MHLAYLDDSDTKQKPMKLQVMAGVIIDGATFKMVDISMRSVRNQLIPEDRLDKFEEFHACELYGGHGVFAGIEQEKRFEAINKLLALLDFEGTAVVYGAVDIAKMKHQVYGSADPLDIAFRICTQEVYEWVKKQIFDDITDAVKERDQAVLAWLQELVILIVDECEPRQRQMLHTSFASMRHPLPSKAKQSAMSDHLAHFHDEMFFGDSRYSVGIQLADLCSYFIARHLQGEDEISPFYGLIEPHIAYRQFYPDDATFKTPQPVLSNFQAALMGFESIGGQRMSEARQDDAPIIESTAPEDESRLEADNGNMAISPAETQKPQPR